MADVVSVGEHDGWRMEDGEGKSKAGESLTVVVL